MKDIIQFRQHIRTSSRARGGYRTYQYTAPMDELNDDKLGGYGVYTSTAYPDMTAIRPEQRPELFLFYNLDPQTKVVCRSTYIGLDLHSFPPRSGNYISHALIADSHKRFNPVEVYEKMPWKSAAGVAAEDNNSLPIPETIPPLTVELDLDFYDLKWFNDLIIPAEEGAIARPEEFALRQQMFMAVVDAIIRQQKVIIIDKKEKLLPWTMCLLQVFPLDFVFKYLTITSFANSNTLMDICQVLCFETENTERVRRFADKALVFDINSLRSETPSSYARVLVGAILAGDFARFRQDVFPRISAGAHFPEQFDKHARFYDQLAGIDNMPLDTFKEFFTSQADVPAYVERIAQIAIQNNLKDHCNTIWRVLLSKKPLSIDDLRTYTTVSAYTISGVTDELWMDLEQELAGKLALTTLERIKNFFNVTRFIDARRDTPFYNSVIKIVKSSPDQKTKEEGLKMIKDFALDLTDGQKKEMESIQQHIDLLDTLEGSPVQGQYTLFLEQYPSLSEAQRSDAVHFLKPVTWKGFFEWTVKDMELLRSLYEIPALASRLPEKELAFCMLHQDMGDQGKLKKLIAKLPPDNKQEFYEYVSPSLRDKLIEHLPLEDALLFAPSISVGRILSAFIERNKKDPSYIELWELCDTVQFPYRHAERKPNTVSLVKEKDLSGVYGLLNNEDIRIPLIYEQLATILHDNRLIKRAVPRKEMDITLEHLRAIHKLEHLGSIKNYLKKNSMDLKFLYTLVKLPWPHYAWEMVFEALDEDNRIALPNLLGELLGEMKRINEANPGSSGRSTLSYRKWWHTIYQYYIFLIIKNEYEHLVRLTATINLNWEQYKFILDQLVVLLPEENAASHRFRGYTNKQKNGFGISSYGPKWQIAL